jgi:hypothetical protein
MIRTPYSAVFSSLPELFLIGNEWKGFWELNVCDIITKLMDIPETCIAPRSVWKPK